MLKLIRQIDVAFHIHLTPLTWRLPDTKTSLDHFSYADTKIFSGRTSFRFGWTDKFFIYFLNVMVCWIEYICNCWQAKRTWLKYNGIECNWNGPGVHDKCKTFQNIWIIFGLVFFKHCDTFYEWHDVGSSARLKFFWSNPNPGMTSIRHYCTLL